MHLKRYFLCFMVSSGIYAQAEYSEKELAALIKIEYRTLLAQENLLRQSMDNENMKQATEKTIIRIKQRIAELKNQKKAR